MPKCPKCNKEIDKLYEVCAGEDNTIHRNEPGYVPGTETEYECPECQETLFSNPGDAENFLEDQNES